MKSLIFVVLLAASGSIAAKAGVLPLRSGTYVRSDTPCRDAPFAAMMAFDGKGLSDPHSARCRSHIVSRSGRIFRVDTRCTANGDGSPATPTTEAATLKIRSQTAFVYIAAGPVANAASFRLCPPDAPAR